MACDGGLENCAIASFPWIIAGLLALVLVLILLRFVLQFLDRMRPPRSPRPAPAPREPLNVPIGSPLAPPAPGDEPPPRETERRPPPRPAPPEKPKPLQLRVSDAPDLRLADFRGDQGVQADFGELLTSAVLSTQGWKQLPSKAHGGRGIDGIFVRELKGGGGYECLAIEGKTNSVNYNPAAMTDEKLSADIESLYELGALTKTEADELLRALGEGPSFFRKELWRHDLSSGLTTITELDRKGEKGKSRTRSNARLMSALFMSLEQFDRGALYLGDRPVDDDGR